jgi:hypothetical protein
MNNYVLKLLILICLVCKPSRGKLNKVRARETSERGDLAQNLPVPVESVVFGGDASPRVSVLSMTTQPAKRVSVPTMKDVDNYLVLTANGVMHVLDKSLNHLSSHDTGGLLLNSWQQENDPNLSILPAADGAVIVQENEGLSCLLTSSLVVCLSSLYFRFPFLLPSASGMRKTSVLTRLKDLATQASGEEHHQGVHVTGKMSQTFVGIPLDGDIRGQVVREPHRAGLSTGSGVGHSISVITKPNKMLYFSRKDWTLSGSTKTESGNFAEKVILNFC